jgi:hypothetical protein
MKYYFRSQENTSVFHVMGNLGNKNQYNFKGYDGKEES